MPFGSKVYIQDQRSSSLCTKLTAYVLLAIVLNACSSVQKRTEVTHPAAVTPSQSNEIDKKAVVRPSTVQPNVRLAANILLSSDIPAYGLVAEELVKKLGKQNTKIYRLDKSTDKAGLLHNLQQSTYRYVIAIGLPAAQIARSLEGKSIIFCQVLSYEQHDLVGPHARGVKMIPPLSGQLSAWNMVSPEMESVAMFTGGGMQHIATEAHTAASEFGINLIHKIVGSDKEFLYEFKRSAPHIDGLWLVPDNRILSHRVIREIMYYSNKHKIQVLGFDPQLLKLGALLSATNQPEDIAGQVIAILEKDAIHMPITDITPLTNIQLHINVNAAKKFGLSVPPSSPALTYVAWPDNGNQKSP